MSDVFPALVVLSFLVWREIMGEKNRIFRYAFISSYVITGLFALWINTYQGLYNMWPFMWNGNPYYHQDPRAFLFNWKCPQFLATEESIKESILDYIGRDKYDVEIDFEKKRMVVTPK
jgi:hypothetical protein